MRGEWEEDAACARIGGDLWFPKGYKDREDKAQAVYAAGICWAECPVRVKCLRHALAREEGLAVESRYGVWGGMTPLQRFVWDTARVEARGSGSVAA